MIENSFQIIVDLEKLDEKFLTLCPEEDQSLSAIEKWAVMCEKAKTKNSKIRFIGVLRFGYVTIEKEKDLWKTMIKKAKVYYNDKGWVPRYRSLPRNLFFLLSPLFHPSL